MKVEIKSIDELIEFVNREDVSKEDALKVAEKCFGVISIAFVDEARAVTYDKKCIIEKINESVNKTDKYIWLMWQTLIF